MPARAPTSVPHPGDHPEPPRPHDRTADDAPDPRRDVRRPPADDEDLRDVPSELWHALAELARTPEVEPDPRFLEEPAEPVATAPPDPSRGTG